MSETTWSTRKESEKWIFLGVWYFLLFDFFLHMSYLLNMFYCDSRIKNQCQFDHHSVLLFIVCFSLDLPMMNITRYWFISYLKLLLKVTLKHWKGNFYNYIDATIILWEEGVGSKSMRNKRKTITTSVINILVDIFVFE